MVTRVRGAVVGACGACMTRPGAAVERDYSGECVEGDILCALLTFLCALFIKFNTIHTRIRTAV